MPESDLKLDALFTIFEKHLYNFEDNEESEVAFVEKIVQDYIQYLVTNQVAVPKRWQHHITEELKEQVRKMLVKKMYGCLSIREFTRNQTDSAQKRRTSKKKYSKLGF